MSTENNVTGNDECVKKLLDIFGLEYCTEFNLTVSVNKEMIVAGNRWVKVGEFEQIVEVLRKYKIEQV